MLFNTQYLSLIFCVSTLSSGLPLEGTSYPHAIAQRAKSYSIINVDGGSTSALPAATIIEEKTKTEIVEVTAIESAATSTITTIVTQSAPAPAPAPTSVSSSTTTSAALVPISTSKYTPRPPPSYSENPTETSKPSVVTVIVTAPAGPTEYYDNGLWHTSYIIKTFEVVTATAAAAATPSLPV